MNMWTNGFNGYNTYGNALQQDGQPINWFNQNASSGLSNPFAQRFDNSLLGGTTNPFAGQTFSNIYQPYSGFGNGFGYQYRGW